MDTRLEPWLRGPLPGVPALLQPVAHALVHAREEVPTFVRDVGGAALWARPAGRASVGFHLQHLAGVLDRLLTYARGEALTEAQLAALRAEGVPDPALTVAELVAEFEGGVDRALAQIRATDPATLIDARGVGREEVPSTVLGLLVHAAEHTQRHAGQLLVTASVVASAPPP